MTDFLRRHLEESDRRIGEQNRRDLVDNGPREVKMTDLRDRVREVPKPLYSCLHCFEEYSWPAGDLFWSEREQGWVCGECWPDRWFNEDETSGCDEDYGPSLSTELKGREIAEAKRLLAGERLSDEAAYVLSQKYFDGTLSRDASRRIGFMLGVRIAQDHLLGPEPEPCGTAKLHAANEHIRKHFPLPRCEHGNPLQDHGGNRLEPSCGCAPQPKVEDPGWPENVMQPEDEAPQPEGGGAAISEHSICLGCTKRNECNLANTSKETCNGFVSDGEGPMPACTGGEGGE